MSGWRARLALVALGLVMASVPTLGQGAAPGRAVASMGEPLQATHPTLRARLDRIAAGSALWREAVEAAGKLGRRVIVLTPDQVHPSAVEGRAKAGIDSGLLAEAMPIAHDGVRINAVVVVVNLPLIADVHARMGSLPGEHDADLDRILIHEVYGHALPYLLSGTLAGRCADPAEGERASQACAIQRENAVRGELGLGRRVDAGLQGLSLARATSRW
ncbi:MAG: hypothetical protein IT177_13085 [Acidobacteria bacterium]|nr:hypothetical protein [Acidobacteriota bacterium]